MGKPDLQRLDVRCDCMPASPRKMTCTKYFSNTQTTHETAIYQCTRCGAQKRATWRISSEELEID